MPSTGRIGKLTEKSKSFHGKVPAAKTDLRRPKTHPDLFSGANFCVSPAPTLTKVLVNVTVKGSLGAVHEVMDLESTVGDVVEAAVRQYVKQQRRPLLVTANPQDFDLHYSQFSLQSLDRKEKLTDLGSRNFFLCPKAVATTYCSTQAEKVSSAPFPWLRFMDFLL